MTIYEEAVRLVNSGLSVLPIRTDGSKQPWVETMPDHKWGYLQERRPTAAELRAWWGNGEPHGIALIAGAVSGHVELIDFDDVRLVGPWLAWVKEAAPGLIDRLVVVRTPRPGFGVWYRASEPVPGNQKLAVGLREAADPETGEITLKRKTLIETRGEGGYALIPPSPPECHPTHREYQVRKGDLAALPVLTRAERGFLIEAARALSELIEPEREPRRPAASVGEAGERPGDDYNARGDFAALLEQHGWRLAYQRGEVSYWRRPGKERGMSATLGAVAPGVLNVFSTNAFPLEDRTYDLFGAYCVAPSTRLLTADMTWVEAGSLREGDELVGVDEFPLRLVNGATRALRVSVVEKAAQISLPSVRVEFRDGRSVVCSEDHCWLSKSDGAAQNTRWRRAAALKPGQRVCALVSVPLPEPATSFEMGWLSGMFDGEGWASQHQMGIAQNPGPVLERVKELLDLTGVRWSGVPRSDRYKGVEYIKINRNRDQLRLLLTLAPLRLTAKRHWVGRGVRVQMADDAFVSRVTPIGACPLVAVQTSTRTYIAEGLVSHNCQLVHGGDFAAATRALRQQGYGAERAAPARAAPPGAVPAAPASGDFPLTDYGNAERMARDHGDELRYTQAHGWLAWDGRRWQRDETGEAARQAKESVREMYREAADLPDKARDALVRWALASESTRRVKDMLWQAQSERPFAVRAVEFDTHPMLLNCANGTLDPRTGKIRPHARVDLLTRLCPVEYRPEANCPVFERFLADVLGDDADLQGFLQRAIGYSLTGDTSEQCLFFLHGSGSNGKSTLLQLLLRLLGDYGLPAPPHLLLEKNHEEHPTEVATLAGRRIVTTVEVGQGKRLAEELVKQLTGGDTIQARFMRHDYFPFRPEFKLFLAANHKPVIRGTDTAIWRRIPLIPFNTHFTDNPAEGQRRKDPSLPEKLERELPGILAWAVRGCRDWTAGGLRPPRLVIEATDAYRQEMDRVGQFLDECCQRTAGKEETKDDLYRGYEAWCRRSGERQVSKNEFGSSLLERGFKDDRRGRACTRVWVGVELVETDAPPPDPRLGE